MTIRPATLALRASGLLLGAATVIGWALLFAATLSALSVWFSPWFLPQLKEALTGRAASVDSVDAQAERVIAVLWVGSAGCIWLVADKLRLLVQAARKDEVFATKNPGRLRLVAAGFAGLQVLAFAMEIALPRPPQDRVLTADVQGWMLIATILILAEVFRRGKDMQDDLSTVI